MAGLLHRTWSPWTEEYIRRERVSSRKHIIKAASVAQRGLPYILHVIIIASASHHKSFLIEKSNLSQTNR